MAGVAGLMKKSQEIWKTVSFDSRYEVSNFGRVRGGVTGALKKLTHRSDGYMVVAFYYGPGHTRTRLLHRLVLLAFKGEPPTPKHQAAHWDGNKTNNVLTNLRWATSSENNLDKKRHGTFTNPRRYGEKNHKAKLTVAKVREIRRLHGIEGRSMGSLAREHGVSVQSISAVIARRNWAHVN